MNKQVIDVYDGMAMPADCARRIEGEMSRAIRQKKGETKFMKNEKNGQKQSWGFAVVLVCLVLVLSVGGVFLFLNVSGSIPRLFALASPVVRRFSLGDTSSMNMVPTMVMMAMTGT